MKVRHVLVLFVALCVGCASAEVERCLVDAGNVWRAEVARCAAHEQSSEECELERITAERAEAEDQCLE